ncbi:MAG: hypothetical protein ACRENI_04480 [Gemmatimonadaceae bacterium]
MSDAAKAGSRVEKNWLEWLVFWIALAIVSGTVGLLAFAALRHEPRPPGIRVRADSARAAADHYIVRVVAENTGDRTAGSVQIDVVLFRGGAAPEHSTVVLDFLPRQSTRDGWVTFDTDPRTADSVVARAEGYVIP